MRFVALHIPLILGVKVLLMLCLLFGCIICTVLTCSHGSRYLYGI